jgi:hypothetical protein
MSHADGSGTAAKGIALPLGAVRPFAGPKPQVKIVSGAADALIA